MVYTSTAKVNLNKIIPVLLQVLTVISELLDSSIVKFVFPKIYKKLDMVDNLIEQLIEYLKQINIEQLAEASYFKAIPEIKDVLLDAGTIAPTDAGTIVFTDSRPTKPTPNGE